ncbi:MAG: PIN domain-containing protein [Alphaproteobacteria bacterium]|nr:PIN domain-containing protein [Alphaproteobacteria bacterium]
MTAFLDSNILVYAYSTHVKRARAMSLVADGGVISAQVLNEFTNVLRNKQKQEWPVIERALASVRLRFPDILPLTADTHAAALALARDHSFSFYDALIVAAAIEAGCDTLWSEDMQYGRVIGGLTIRDPFAA